MHVATTTPYPAASPSGSGRTRHRQPSKDRPAGRARDVSPRPATAGPLSRDRTTCHRIRIPWFPTCDGSRRRPSDAVRRWRTMASTAGDGGIGLRLQPCRRPARRPLRCPDIERDLRRRATGLDRPPPRRPKPASSRHVDLCVFQDPHPRNVNTTLVDHRSFSSPLAGTAPSGRRDLAKGVTDLTIAGPRPCCGRLQLRVARAAVSSCVCIEVSWRRAYTRGPPFRQLLHRRRPV